MATVVNNPAPSTHEVREVQSGEGSGTGVVVGIILAILLLVLFFAYGLPAFRGGNNSGGTNINVPDKVNVDVNKGQ
jgi:hypothetical protein